LSQDYALGNSSFLDFDRGGAMNERDVFIAALQKQNAADRSAFLAGACGGDTDLREQVEALLRENEQLGSFVWAFRSQSATMLPL